MAAILNGSVANLIGLSTEKPEEAELYTLYLEVDTGDFYYYDGESWAKVGGDS